MKTQLSLHWKIRLKNSATNCCIGSINGNHPKYLERKAAHYGCLIAVAEGVQGQVASGSKILPVPSPGWRVPHAHRQLPQSIQTCVNTYFFSEIIHGDISCQNSFALVSTVLSYKPPFATSTCRHPSVPLKLPAASEMLDRISSYNRLPLGFPCKFTALSPSEVESPSVPL